MFEKYKYSSFKCTYNDHYYLWTLKCKVASLEYVNTSIHSEMRNTSCNTDFISFSSSARCLLVLRPWALQDVQLEVWGSELPVRPSPPSYLCHNKKLPLLLLTTVKVSQNLAGNSVVRIHVFSPALCYIRLMSAIEVFYLLTFLVLSLVIIHQSGGGGRMDAALWFVCFAM